MEHEQVGSRCIVAMVRTSREAEHIFAGRQSELTGLCEAAGSVVIASVMQVRDRPDPTYYVGSGKAMELSQSATELGVDIIVVDGELSPAQVRNLERILPCRVVDRTQVILDIFAARAQSREGMLQVEIAQLQYLMPRLTGRGAELSRLGGGIGTRGPGETKLETDRRRIRQRIDRLHEQIRQIEKRRTINRAQRVKGVPIVALVGYTNAGKTSLLRRWTDDRGEGASEVGRNRLFDTLDPVARRVKSASGSALVVLDTVGFVQDLPHLLVDAFRATLEEVLTADVIVHVIDGSEPDVQVRLQTTYDVLGEIGAMDKPVLAFVNKADLSVELPGPDKHAQKTLYGSAQTGQNVDRLYTEVETLMGLDVVYVTVQGNQGSSTFWREVGQMGTVVKVVPRHGDEIEAIVSMERRMASRWWDATQAHAIQHTPELSVIGVTSQRPHLESPQALMD